MDLHADIISGRSIANLSLGTELRDVLLTMRQSNIGYVESSFENIGGKFTLVDVANGTVSILADDTERVVRLTCGVAYHGKYRKKLHPGMTVRQICDFTSSQLVIHGMLVVEKDYGAFFDVPEMYNGEPFDDIDAVHELPPEMRLQEIHVMNPEWWR